MKQDQFKGHIKQVKDEYVEITAKFLRAKRLKKKGRAQKMRARVENGHGDFKDTIQHDNDFEDDISCNRNSRMASK
jgi:uncharacterized protein YjbJ (UPF0337 family)